VNWRLIRELGERGGRRDQVKMSFNKSRGGAAVLGGGDELVLRGTISKKWTLLLCLASFCIGLIFTNRMWTMPEPKEIIRRSALEVNKMNLLSGDCAPKSVSINCHTNIFRLLCKHHLQ
jgi:hypothetical protein